MAVVIKYTLAGREDDTIKLPEQVGNGEPTLQVEFSGGFLVIKQFDGTNWNAKVYPLTNIKEVFYC